VYIEIVAFYKYIASCHFFTGSCGSRFCFISIITNGKSETPYQKQKNKQNKTKKKKVCVLNGQISSRREIT